MIKKFEQFVRSLNEDDKPNPVYIVNNTNITPGSSDLAMVRKFVTEMTKMSLPQGEKNIGRIIEFCVDNYHEFKDKESQDLAAEVNEIKAMIKDFFANTEIEMEMLKSDWFGGFGDKTKTDVTVDAVFGKNNGMLRLFFDTFSKTKKNTTRNSEGLDNSVYGDIKTMVQRLKEDWDPVGWDAWTWIGGDSDAVEAFKRTLEERYGAYADAKIAYLNGQYEPPTGDKPGEKTIATPTSPVNQGSVKSDTTSSSTTQQATTTTKKTSTPTQKTKPAGTSGKPLSFR